MKNPYPSTEELYALQHEARRMRAAEIARLLRSGINAMRALFARTEVRNAKGLRHA